MAEVDIGAGLLGSSQMGTISVELTGLKWVRPTSIGATRGAIYYVFVGAAEKLPGGNRIHYFVVR